MSDAIVSIDRPFRTIHELRAWADAALGLKIPALPVCPHHSAPLEYLRRSYFEPANDLVVWAPRGGGKTRLGALATFLDLLHKPRCSVRILGGSLEQSLRMWEHLHGDLLELAEKQLDGRSRARRIHLLNGASAAVLTQSQRNVRGQRVQKLRCDEVDEFDPEIWEAAQLTVRSLEKPAGDDWPPIITGSVHALSTLHRPFGLMQRIIDQAEAANTHIIKWCLLDVLQRCPPERTCADCDLRDDCNGVAKSACEGFFSIEDAIRAKRRVSLQTWECEMLCRRPAIRDSVFPEFNPEIHIADSPLGRRSTPGEIWLAIDFGYSNPFACLWIHCREDGIIHVIDEYIQQRRPLHEHIVHIQSRAHPPATHVACDPSGNGKNDQTAQSNVDLLRQHYNHVHTKGSRIADGLEKIRAGLRPAAGDPTLFVHPRCKKLIRAFQSYHFAPGGSELPLKDNENDHPIDALRYFYINHRGGNLRGRPY